MKTRVPAAIAAVCLSLVPAVVSAQTGSRAPVKPPGDGTEITLGGGDGTFKSTDGTRGTFSQTVRFYSATSSGTTVIYVRSSDGAKRIETTADQTGPDGIRTETFTSIDYNASSSFQSDRTITELGRGQYAGQGIYTTAEGVSGTLTTLETQSATGVDTTTFVYNSAVGGISTEQRTQTEISGKTVIKTASVDASGKSASVVQTRAIAPSLGTFPLLP